MTKAENIAAALALLVLGYMVGKRQAGAAAAAAAPAAVAPAADRPWWEQAPKWAF